MNTCPNCGKIAGLHSSILQGCMCQYSTKALPQREWKGLTDEEILADDVLRYHFALNGGAGPISKKGKAIIDVLNNKLKDKNYD